MSDKQTILAMIAAYEDKKARVNVALEALSAYDTALSDHIRLLKEVAEKPEIEGLEAELSKAWPLPLHLAELPTTTERQQFGTTVFEAILREKGKMHLDKLLSFAEARGVPFSGKQPKRDQLRSRLTNSKRFVLLGDNEWDIANRETKEPEQTHLDALINDALAR